MRKRIFIANAILGSGAEAAESALAAEPGVELVYGLSAAERAQLARGEGDRARAHERALAALDEALPTLHALLAVGVTGAFGVTRAMIERGRQLELIFVPGAGFENIDVAAATEHSIAVVNGAGGNATAVSDHAVGLMLALGMRIAAADRRLHRERRWLGYPQVEAAIGWPSVLSGKVVGVIGYGYVGREIARKCREGFRCEVLAHDPYFDPVEMARQGVTAAAGLGELLERSDYVSVSTSLASGSPPIVGEAELRRMKPAAFLVNTSRGATVDGGALLRALREGWIAGAGLDVTDPEPLPDGHPLYELDNVILTPHLAGKDPDFHPSMAAAVAADVARCLRRERPFHLVNPDVWPRFLARAAG